MVELMIVVAIVGLLASIAMPAYSSYIARSQISEGLVLLSGLKTGFTEFYDERGRWPSLIGSVSASASGKYVASISISSGANSTNALTLEATMRTDVNSYIASKSVILTSTSGQSWSCSAGTVSEEFLPAACR